MRHPLRDWRKLGEAIQHRPGNGIYVGVAVNSEGLLATTDCVHKCIHLLRKEGSLVRSIGKGMLGGDLYGITFDLKGNVWVADTENDQVLKLSQDGQLLQTIDHVGSKLDHINHPLGMSVSPEGLVYICDSGNHRVTVHDEEGMFLFILRSGRFSVPSDLTFGSDGLVYVTDGGRSEVSVWSKEGSFRRNFKTKYIPIYIAATGDNHLLITSHSSDTVMVYTLGGQLVHEFGRCGRYSKFGGRRSDLEWVGEPFGICVDDSGAVYIALNNAGFCVQVF